MTFDIRTAIAAIAVATALLSGCGGDDEPATPDATSVPDGGAEEVGAEIVEGGSGGTGRIVLDGETVDLAVVRCHLEPQPAAAGGGNILFVVQGEGADSSGDTVMIDVTRYDDESMFAGDDVQIYVGDVTAGDAVELSATGPSGLVTLEGSTASVDDLTVEDLTTGAERTASFEISC